MPGLIRASVCPRKIDYQHRRIDPFAHHCGKSGAHLVFITPDKGVVIKRIGNRYKRAKTICECLLICLRYQGPVKTHRFAEVGDQASLATGTAHGTYLRAGKRAEQMQNLQIVECYYFPHSY